MTTFEDVFHAFGGPAALATAIGIAPGHAQTMKTRGSIPDAYWLAVVEAAKSRRIRGVTLDALARMAAARGKRQRAAS